MRCCWVLLLCVGLVFINCSLNEPQLPSWDTTLNFPVTDKTYDFNTLIEENDEFFNYDDGLLGLSIEGKLDPIKVEKNLKLDPISKTMELSVSEVELPQLSVGRLTFAPGMLIPDSDEYWGQPRPVDRLPIDDVGVSVDTPNEQRVEAETLSGILRLSFQNQLPVPFEINEINLKESQDGRVKLSHQQVIPIAADSEGRLDIRISDVTLSTDDYWSISGTSLGSNGQEVIVNESDVLNIEIELVNLNVEHLSAPADYFVVDKTDSVLIGKAVCIRTATFDSGEIVFDIDNQLAFDLNLSIISPQFLHIVTGEPLSFHTIVTRHRITHKSLNIADYKIEYKGELKKPQCVELHVRAQGVESEGQVALSRTDALTFSFAMRGVIINQFKGLLDQFMVGIKPRTHSVVLPGSIGDINGFYLDDPQLSLDFYNTLEMPLRLEGTMLGKASDGKSEPLTIAADIEAGKFDQPVKTSLQFESEQQDQVKKFARLLPETIVFSGSTFVGKGLAEGMISSESYIQPLYKLETPACFSWNETVFSPEPVLFVIVPEDYRGEVNPEAHVLKAEQMDRLQDFQVDGAIKNSLPISGSIEFYFVKHSKDGAEEIHALKTVEIDSAVTDKNGERQSRTSAINVSLGVAGVHILQNHESKPKELSFHTEITLNSSNGKKVKVYESDSIAVKAAAHIIAQIE